MFAEHTSRRRSRDTRTRLAELLRKLDETGATVVGLDLVLAEPDRTSPENATPSWGETAERIRDAPRTPARARCGAGRGGAERALRCALALGEFCRRYAAGQRALGAVIEMSGK